MTATTEFEDAALTLVGTIVARAALQRAETRGAHTRLDAPNADPNLCRSTAFRIDHDGAIATAPTPLLHHELTGAH